MTATSKSLARALARRIGRPGALIGALGLAIGCSVALAPLCGVAQAAVVDRVVAVVNKEIILQSELDQMALPTYRDPDRESSEGRRKLEVHRRKVLDQLVEKQLVQEQAKEMKLTVSEDDVKRATEEVKRNNGLTDEQFVEALKGQGFTMEAYRKQLRQQILELKVVSQAVRSRVSIADDEIRAFYAQNVRQASGDDVQVHLRVLSFLLPPGAATDQLEARRKQATQVLERARAGEAFEALAKAYGEDPVSKSGGDLGWLARADLPTELREVVAAMDSGDLRGPVRTDKGLQILQLVEKKNADVRPYEEVKEQLRRQLYEQQVEKATQNWLKELRRKAHVDIRL